MAINHGKHRKQRKYMNWTWINRVIGLIIVLIGLTILWCALGVNISFGTVPKFVHMPPTQSRMMGAGKTPLMRGSINQGDNCNSNTVVNIENIEHASFVLNTENELVKEAKQQTEENQQANMQPAPLSSPAPAKPEAEQKSGYGSGFKNLPDIDVVCHKDESSDEYKIKAGAYQGFNIVGEDGWYLCPVQYWGDPATFTWGLKKASNGNIFYYWYQNNGVHDIKVRFTMKKKHWWN